MSTIYPVQLQTLYHYTDTLGLVGILNSGKILQAFTIKGNGVFFTRLHPENGKEVLARNNYNNAYLSKQDKVSCYIRILIPIDEIYFDHFSQGRDIFIVPGRDIHLHDYTWGFGCTDVGGSVCNLLGKVILQSEPKAEPIFQQRGFEGKRGYCKLIYRIACQA